MQKYLYKTPSSVNDNFHGGTQRKFHFNNGYGASVVCHEFSYGGREGLFELAVLDNAGNIDYSTPLGTDVLGYLTEDDVQAALLTIEALPRPETIILRIRCVSCQEIQTVVLPFEGYRDWKQGRKLIQQALPDVAADIRELLISKTCGKCFDELFAEEPDGEDSVEAAMAAADEVMPS